MPPKYNRGGGGNNNNNNSGGGGGGGMHGNYTQPLNRRQEHVPQNNIYAQQVPQGVPLAAAPQQQIPQQGSSPCGDSFGMLGLVSDIKTDTVEAQNKQFLVRGFDLGQLGLNLVDTSHLFPTFASPWHDTPSLLVPEFKVPTCYKVEVGRITYNTFQKFSIATCFYVFYSMPKDLLQVAAAKELVTRGYFFHIVQKQWVKLEDGAWKTFNPEKWEHEPLVGIPREEDLMRTVPTASAPAAGQPASATA
eukprot:GILI01015585.1.p1 GENE.GILI01015585.1~~GILI01015585.1.p1  ORF type:complete len:248 (-),score=46.68 GILI01015585.1:65-808(-)